MGTADVVVFGLIATLAGFPGVSRSLAVRARLQYFDLYNHFRLGFVMRGSFFPPAAVLSGVSRTMIAFCELSCVNSFSDPAIGEPGHNFGQAPAADRI